MRDFPVQLFLSRTELLVQQLIRHLQGRMFQRFDVSHTKHGLYQNTNIHMEKRTKCKKIVVSTQYFMLHILKFLTDVQNSQLYNYSVLVPLFNFSLFTFHPFYIPIGPSH
uniref:Uncharacterized protein n=1 Tax=Cuerna arida TaxID=1464854 RepID=A0A1B6G8H5_9HEMI